MDTFRQYISSNKENFKQYLAAGGAAGHMSNVFDLDLTFGEIKDIIDKSLSGKLGYTTLKTDGQNILITYKDGQIRAARNKSHLKNFGETAMTATDLAQKFKGRGALEFAYNNAVKDLYTAISKLSDKQVMKIFKNGAKFMNMEVIYPEGKNVIDYGKNILMFHNTMEYDIDGNVIDANKEDARVLGRMIKQIEQERQNTFDIIPPQVVKVPPLPDFAKQKSYYIKEFEKIQQKYSLRDSDTLNQYKMRYMKKRLIEIGVNFPSESLIRRFALLDKSYSMAMINKDYSTDIDKIKEFDNNIQEEYKNMMLPIEYIILNLGATILNNLSGLLVLHPEEEKKRLQKDLDLAVKKIRGTKDPKMLKKLKIELQRIEMAGGIEKIFPEEGIVFTYKDNIIKLTGLFSPINQIMGMLWNI